MVLILPKQVVVATVRLDTIARGSSMSLSRSSATIGSDSITVNITRNSSAYKHKVKLILVIQHIY